MAHNLKIVGDRLAQIADGESDPARFDLFSRSAFNRYYYSVYLTVLTALKRIGCAPERPTHTNVRDTLTGTVRKKLRQELKRGQVRGADKDLIHSVSTNGVDELRQLLLNAYRVRCEADYNPKQKVDRIEGTDIAKLAGCTILSASHWQQSADFYTNIIKRAYRRSGRAPLEKSQ